MHTQQVFWSRQDPTAGVIAQSFRDAYVSAGTQAERTRVSGAADAWWRACGLVQSGGHGPLTPMTCAALAVRSGAVYDVGGLVESGLVGNLGEEATQAATTAASEQSWGEWAGEQATAARDWAGQKYEQAKETAYGAYEAVTEAPGQVKQAYQDAKQELKDLADPEPEKVLWPLVAGAVAVVGIVTYAITSSR